MDIHDLKVFQTVAKYRNISKAAEELNFVQSTVTTKMKRLEAHFQTPLFYRHRYGVSLTSSGKSLLKYIEEILHLFTEAEKDIIYSESPKGPIAIGSMETTAAVRLPQVLSTFQDQFSDVELILKTGPTEEMIKQVLSYDLDGAFVAGPIHHEDLLQKEIMEEELVLISKEKSFVNKTLDLKKSTLLVFRRGCSYRKKLEEWLYAEKLVPKKIMEFGSLEAIIGCVSAGLGISLLPKSVITRVGQHYSFVCHEIPQEFANVTTVFIQRKDVVETLAIKNCLKPFNIFLIVRKIWSLKKKRLIIKENSLGVNRLQRKCK